jgi:hypothetical protein
MIMKGEYIKKREGVVMACFKVLSQPPPEEIEEILEKTSVMTSSKPAEIEPSLVCSRATSRPPALFPSLNPKLPFHSHS